MGKGWSKGTFLVISCSEGGERLRLLLSSRETIVMENLSNLIFSIIIWLWFLFLLTFTCGRFSTPVSALAMSYYQAHHSEVTVTCYSSNIVAGDQNSSIVRVGRRCAYLCIVHIVILSNQITDSVRYINISAVSYYSHQLMVCDFMNKLRLLISIFKYMIIKICCVMWRWKTSSTKVCIQISGNQLS